MMTPSRCCAIGTILLLVSFISVTAQQTGNCSVTDAFICQTGFTNELNISGTQNAWTNPDQFRRDVEGFYQRGGIDGLRRVCRAFRNYKNCLGPQYAACTSVPAYVQAGIKLQPAWEYVKIFGQFHFICGAGFNTYLNNDDCMSTAWRVNQTRLEYCRQQFDASVINDRPNACYFAQQEILCYEGPFQQSCGFTARGPTWWACEYARFSSVQQYPQCGLRCTIPAVGGVVG